MFLHILYMFKLIIHSSFVCVSWEGGTNLEHIFTVDKTKSRMGGLQVVQCLDTQTECYVTNKANTVSDYMNGLTKKKN